MSPGRRHWGPTVYLVSFSAARNKEVSNPYWSDLIGAVPDARSTLIGRRRTMTSIPSAISSIYLSFHLFLCCHIGCAHYYFFVRPLFSGQGDAEQQNQSHISEAARELGCCCCSAVPCAALYYKMSDMRGQRRQYPPVRICHHSREQCSPPPRRKKKTKKLIDFH